MKKHFLIYYLPQEIWREILRRLPIRSIVSCKRVCKSWRDLIEGGDFLTSYTPKPWLAFGNKYMGYAVCEACEPLSEFRLDDSDLIEEGEIAGLYTLDMRYEAYEACEPLFQFRLIHSDLTHDYSRIVIDSVNGLLLVWDRVHKYHDNIFIICNPITREYSEIPLIPFDSFIFGLGVSKLSGQYKIILGDQWRPRHVYTVGREGLWRSIVEEVATPRLDIDGDAKFLNGNLHWLASDCEGNPLICCFDLETELATSFSLPPRVHGYGGILDGGYGLCILEDLLCLCDITNDLHVVIWRMNTYGDANSWLKEYTFDQKPYIGETGFPDVPKYVLPLKVLENGDLLFTVNIDCRLFIYSKNTEAVEIYGLLQRSIYCYDSNVTIYTPTFLSLKSVGIRDIQSLSFY